MIYLLSHNPEPLRRARDKARMPKGQLVLCLMRPPATDERHFKNAAAFDSSRWLEANASGGRAP